VPAFAELLDRACNLLRSQPPVDVEAFNAAIAPVEA
jgi:hypothetical protein